MVTKSFVVTVLCNQMRTADTMIFSHSLNTSWKERCHKDYGKKWQTCWVANPWPGGKEVKEGQGTYDSGGMLYNCFVNEKVGTYWGPKLRDALRKRRQSWAARGQRTRRG